MNCTSQQLQHLHLRSCQAGTSRTPSRVPVTHEMDHIHPKFDTAALPQNWSSTLPFHVRPACYPSHNLPNHPASTFDRKVERDFEETANRQNGFAVQHYGSLEELHAARPEIYFSPPGSLHGFSSGPPSHQQSATAMEFFTPGLPYLAPGYPYDDLGPCNGLPAGEGLLSPPGTPRYDEFAPSPSTSSDESPSEVDYNGKSGQEPYAQLIFRALMSVPTHRMVLKDIYQWVKDHSDRADNANSTGWQNSIRHNLSMNQAFLKIPYEPEDRTNHKGGYIWALADDAVRYRVVLPTTRYRKQENKNRARVHKRPQPTRLAKLSRKADRQIIKAEKVSPTSSPYLQDLKVEDEINDGSDVYSKISASSLPSPPEYFAGQTLQNPLPCPTPTSSPVNYDNSFEQTYQLPTSLQDDADLWYDGHNTDLQFDNWADPPNPTFSVGITDQLMDRRIPAHHSSINLLRYRSPSPALRLR